MSAKRVNYYKYLGHASEHLFALEKELESSSIDAKLLELIKLRVSQINGCSFCVSLHTQLLRVFGEEDSRIDQVAVWHEAPCFSEQEKIAFRWAETVTQLADTRHVSDELYQQTVEAYGEDGISQLTLAVAMINLWNRFGVAFQTDHRSIKSLVDAKRPKQLA